MPTWPANVSQSSRRNIAVSSGCELTKAEEPRGKDSAARELEEILEEYDKIMRMSV
jgi:hypothetical protein